MTLGQGRRADTTMKPKTYWTKQMTDVAEVARRLRCRRYRLQLPLVIENPGPFEGDSRHYIAEDHSNVDLI